MRRPTRLCPPLLRLARLAVLGTLALGAMGSPCILADPSRADEIPPPLPLPADLVDPAAVVKASEVQARASVEGVASPGLRIRLRGDESIGEGLEYQWHQTWGPTAALDDPTAANPTLLVPRAAGSLAFVLVVRNSTGIDMATARIPIQWEGRDEAPPDLLADAGDDQLAFVGRQVTLNGIRSTPRGEVGYRWLQIEGPPVSLAIEDGYIYTFVPDRAGSYRFALVVASGNAISEPAFVTIDVRADPATQRSHNQGPPIASHPVPVPNPGDRSIGAVAASTLQAVPDGEAMAEQLAEVFEGVAARVDLYESAGEAFREVALRLDACLPEGPEERQQWNARVFEPISSAILGDLASQGIDLSRTEAMTAPLGPEVRSVLAIRFRGIADGFRSVAVAASGHDGVAPAGVSHQINQTSATTEQGRRTR